MILKIFFSETEINDFFSRHGYTVELRDFGKFGNIYHGGEEWIEAVEPAVVISGKSVKAAELFESVAAVHIKSIINCTPAEIIESEFNKLTK